MRISFSRGPIFVMTACVVLVHCSSASSGSSSSSGTPTNAGSSCPPDPPPTTAPPTDACGGRCPAGTCTPQGTCNVGIPPPLGGGGPSALPAPANIQPQGCAPGGSTTGGGGATTGSGGSCACHAPLQACSDPLNCTNGCPTIGVDCCPASAPYPSAGGCTTVAYDPPTANCASYCSGGGSAGSSGAGSSGTGTSSGGSSGGSSSGGSCDLGNCWNLHKSTDPSCTTYGGVTNSCGQQIDCSYLLNGVHTCTTFTTGAHECGIYMGTQQITNMVCTTLNPLSCRQALGCN